jgi:putative transposase
MLLVMINSVVFLFNFVFVCLRAMMPGGIKAVASENLALRQQLITLGRHQKRSPTLKTSDRMIFGILTSLIHPKRLSKVAVLIKPATLFKFHQALVKRKYRLLFSKKCSQKPGPKGPEDELIRIIFEMKQRNPRFGYRRIAMQINKAFGTDIDKDVVRRVLAKYYRVHPENQGPSWLSFLGNAKDSLWSMDMFRCESIALKTHWVMVVMDQFTRRIIGFASITGALDGIAVCRMFNAIISKNPLPKRLSTDNDPLFRFHRWRANLRILDIDEIKSVPHVPVSHPFVERLIGTVRRELLDRALFWNNRDLERKLKKFTDYYNATRCHHGIGGDTPQEKAEKTIVDTMSLKYYQWEKYSQGLFQLPVAA